MTKRVSFKVAQSIKEAGYPQYGSCDEYYNQDGRVIDKFCDINKLIYPAPTYLEAWSWLCEHLNYIDKRKLQSIRIFKGKNKWEIRFNCGCLLDSDDDDDCYYEFMGNTQEEVIEKAIDYLVDNDLIK